MIPVVQINGIPRRLGRVPARRDHRTLRMGKYLTVALPPAPVSVDWTTRIAFPSGEFLNDKLGCCVIAAYAHAIQGWSSNQGQEITISDADVLAGYEAVGGYNPSDPSTDQGCVEIDALNYYRTTGLGGYKIDAFVALQPENTEHVRQAVNLFGGAFIGIDLPQTIQTQTDWEVDATAGTAAAPGSLGGHGVIVQGFDAGWLYFQTWGQRMRMSWAFWLAYCSESYALLSKLWVPATGFAPAGFDYAALLADLNAVTG